MFNLNVEILNLLELVSVALNLAFVILIIKEIKWAWPLGILGSFISIYVFYDVQLYSEAILYFYYVIVGIYGWIAWSRPKGEGLLITEWPINRHLKVFAFGFFLSAILGFIFNEYTDAGMPYADAFSTVFSFIATYMEAKKILSTWYYWIVLNAFSIWLYHSRDLEVYALLMSVYAILSIVGLFNWRKKQLEYSV